MIKKFSQIESIGILLPLTYMKIVNISGNNTLYGKLSLFFKYHNYTEINFLKEVLNNVLK